MELNKIYNEDCLVGMKRIPDKSIDMILCDLPYGTTQNKWDSIIDLDLLWEQYERIIKDNGAIVLTAQAPFNIILGSKKLEWLRYEWVWEKTTATGHLNANKMPMKAHEDVLVFGKQDHEHLLVFYNNLPSYNPQKKSGHVRKVSSAKHKINSKVTSNYREFGLTSYDSTERFPRSVIKFSTDKQKEAFHPTQKPVALFEWLIKTYTNVSDVVLDNCMGSATTAVACMNTDRNFIGFEKEKSYFELGNKRIAENTKQLNLLEV
ncbi:DNA-methyltransferase [Carnobacterium maltaromaticum]|uniref:DNA-methyltransferase n=1 Tax=Carnobacterium maltaromaticum TaxID=2751 RepID=UPI0039AF89A4